MYFDVVSEVVYCFISLFSLLRNGSGFDNVGKIIIVKKIMGEDINIVSFIFGFIIKMIDYEG